MPSGATRTIKTIISIGGEAVLDRMYWGSAAMAYHPQPELETLRDFEWPEAVAQRGIAFGDMPEITDEHKRDLLGAITPTSSGWISRQPASELQTTTSAARLRKRGWPTRSRQRTRLRRCTNAMRATPSPLAIREQLDQIVDPCSEARGTDISIVEMGLLKSIQVDNGSVHVELRITSPSCMMVGYFIEKAEERVGGSPV